MKLDMSTQYLGMTLRSPLVCSSSPLCEELDSLAEMEAYGAGAVVLHSLFEEQIHLESHDVDYYLDFGAESQAEAIRYLPDMSDYNLGPDGYIEHLRAAKALLKIPVIPSLNGHTRGGWLEFGRQIQDAGADALELNIYHLPADPNESAAAVEAKYLGVVRDLRAALDIPLAVKIGQNFSSPVHFCRQLCDEGADALVLFNRFYQPDFSLDTLDVVSTLHLSSPSELPLRLHWVAILFEQVKADLAITGGVHTGRDALKVMLAGGRVAMVTSAILKHGIAWLRKMHDEIEAWLVENEYHAIRQMQGSMSFRRVANPEAYERSNYMTLLKSYRPTRR